jgi:two-component system OmpR family response regulator
VTAAGDFDPDVIVLDIMLPDFDGLEVMKRIRAAGTDVPVLFLTAKDDVKDRIAGLTAGGDDYVTKPFSIEELVARIRGIVRRTLSAATIKDDPEIRVADLVLNEETYEVFRGDNRIELTATEFELLRYLMRNPKRVLSKAQILDRVWSYDFGGRSSIVEIYISYLRKKIDTLGPALIHTVRGVGYVIRHTS